MGKIIKVEKTTKNKEDVFPFDTAETVASRLAVQLTNRDVAVTKKRDHITGPLVWFDSNQLATMEYGVDGVIFSPTEHDAMSEFLARLTLQSHPPIELQVGTITVCKPAGMGCRAFIDADHNQRVIDVALQYQAYQLPLPNLNRSMSRVNPGDK